ncbi:MAG: AlpA family transcriptional regulator [Pseudomonadales bacterium]|nr:AlpA family transcriptional regulator [Pseudomonadales bacterium]
MDTRNPTRILSSKEVFARVGLQRTSIYQMSKTGQFPAPIALGPRRIGWYESDVEQWLASRAIAKAYVGG